VALSGTTAIVGVGESDHVRGAERSVQHRILDVSMQAISDARLGPSDIEGVIPPPSFISAEEIAAHLGMPEVRYAVTVHMGGARPVAALQSAAISSGIAEAVLVTVGWNGYSALRPRPGVERFTGR
jgi:acetyl-CoA acetyltransferase